MRRPQRNHLCVNGIFFFRIQNFYIFCSNSRLLCTGEDLLEYGTVDTVQAEDHFVRVQIEQTTEHGATAPNGQIVACWFCIVPNETATTVERYRILVVSDAVAFLSLRWLMKHFKPIIIIKAFTWLRKLESFVAHPICITPGVIISTS